MIIQSKDEKPYHVRVIDKLIPDAEAFADKEVGKDPRSELAKAWWNAAFHQKMMHLADKAGVRKYHWWKREKAD